MRITLSICFAFLLVACGDGEGTDGGTGDGDSGGADSGGGMMDAGDGDGGGGDDAGGGDDGSVGDDAGGGSDAGSSDAGGSGLSCTSDSDCTSGTEWCEGGRCVACDNSGLACDIACSPDGWAPYTRNGCNPCECGPPNECESDMDCRRGGGGGSATCYAGAFCWCAARTPDCCLGNVCSPSGCTDPSPEGCATRGCERGQECRVADGRCVSSDCSCDTGSWVCTDDCGGGSCVTP